MCDRSHRPARLTRSSTASRTAGCPPRPTTATASAGCGTSGPSCAAVARRAASGARVPARCGDRLQHLPDGHLGGAAHRPRGRRAGWCSRCMTCGRCRRSSCPACRRWHPFILLCSWPRTTPTATPTGWCRCCPRCEHMARMAWTCANSIVPNGVAPEDWGAAARVRADCRGAGHAARGAAAPWSATPARMACATRSMCCWTRRLVCARADAFVLVGDGPRGAARARSPTKAGAGDAAAADPQGAGAGASG